MTIIRSIECTHAIEDLMVVCSQQCHKCRISMRIATKKGISVSAFPMECAFDHTLVFGRWSQSCCLWQMIFLIVQLNRTRTLTSFIAISNRLTFWGKNWIQSSWQNIRISSTARSYHIYYEISINIRWISEALSKDSRVESNISWINLIQLEMNE